jgi:uncharacterized membrane protein
MAVENFAGGLARWLHFVFGIMWIGLLYYFNFVQVAALKEANADGTAASPNTCCRARSGTSAGRPS